MESVYLTLFLMLLPFAPLLVGPNFAAFLGWLFPPQLPRFSSREREELMVSFADERDCSGTAKPQVKRYRDGIARHWAEVEAQKTEKLQPFLVFANDAELLDWITEGKHAPPETVETVKAMLGVGEYRHARFIEARNDWVN